MSVIAVELERGAPMELTANHRVFSATRNGWVAAGDLLAGEALQAQEGNVRVRSVHASDRGLTSVFNLEVYARHEFFVGEARVRVHNAYKTGGGASINNISSGEATRIQNAATKIGKPIHLVGSRASGKAGPGSDWDYIVRATNRERHSIVNSLPGARGRADRTDNIVDFLDGTLDETRPYITFTP